MSFLYLLRYINKTVKHVHGTLGIAANKLRERMLVTEVVDGLGQPSLAARPISTS